MKNWNNTTEGIFCAYLHLDYDGNSLMYEKLKNTIHFKTSLVYGWYRERNRGAGK